MTKTTKVKTWNDKLHKAQAYKVKHLDYRFADIPEDNDMLVATPQIFDDYIKQIPKGESRSIKQMRNELATAYHAQYTCPLTTGIFVRIVAEAAYENYVAGAGIESITPFWRVLDAQSTIVKKLSFDYAFIREQRIKEGIDSTM